MRYKNSIHQQILGKIKCNFVYIYIKGKYLDNAFFLRKERITLWDHPTMWSNDLSHLFICFMFTIWGEEHFHTHTRVDLVRT